MFRRSTDVALLTLFCLGLGVACSPPPTLASARSVPAPETDGLSRSAMWLYVTADTPSGAEAECARVAQVLADESRCQGLLCEPAADLAAEWLENCAKRMPDQAEQIGDLEAGFRDQMERKATACVKEFKKLVTAGCDPERCEEQAQGWATRCGGTEGGVLSTLLVEQVANRNLDGKQKLRLDPRSCSTFSESLQKQAFCASQQACRAAQVEVAAYRARCESDEQLPDVATGLAQLSIAVGAGEEPKLTLVSLESASVEPGSVPLALADGTGAILGLCQKHPVEPVDYLTVRQQCVGTELQVARLSKGQAGQGVLQIHELTIPSIPLTGPYPWLAVAGQAEAQAKVAAEELERALAATLAAPAEEAVGKLVGLVDEHGRWIAETAEAKAVLKARDAELARLFGRLGEIKATGAQRVNDPVALRALHHRAKTRPLADLRTTGNLELGAATAGYWVALAGELPKAMAQYRKGLEPLARRAGDAGDPSAQERRDAQEEAAKHARSCRQKLAQRQAVEAELEQCVRESCDAGKREALVDRWRSAADDVRTALRDADRALTSIGLSARSTSLPEAQRCDAAPW